MRNKLVAMVGDNGMFTVLGRGIADNVAAAKKFMLGTTADVEVEFFRETGIRMKKAMSPVVEMVTQRPAVKLGRKPKKDKEPAPETPPCTEG